MQNTDKTFAWRFLREYLPALASAAVLALAAVPYQGTERALTFMVAVTLALAPVAALVALLKLRRDQREARKDAMRRLQLEADAPARAQRKAIAEEIWRRVDARR